MSDFIYLERLLPPELLPVPIFPPELRPPDPIEGEEEIELRLDPEELLLYVDVGIRFVVLLLRVEMLLLLLTRVFELFNVLLLLRLEVAEDDRLVYVPVETDEELFLVVLEVFDETLLFVRTLVLGAGTVVALLLLFISFPLDGALLYDGRAVVCCGYLSDLVPLFRIAELAFLSGYLLLADDLPPLL